MPISLGDINFALGADTTRLQKSADALVRFGRQVELVSRRQSQGAADAAAALRKQEAAITKVLQQTLNLNAAIRRNDGGAQLADQAAAAFNKYTAALTRTNVSALQFQRATERVNASLGGVRRSLQDVIKGRQAEQFDSLYNSLKNISSVAVLASGPLGGLAARLTAFTSVVNRTNFETAALVAGIAAAAVGMGSLISAVTANAIKLDRVRQQFSAISGSAAIANQLLAESAEIAKKSGTSLVTTADQYAQFLAAVKGTNLEGAKSKEIFETVAQVAGKLGLPIANTEGLFKALQQMVSKGTVQLEELKGQMGDQLPGALQIAARAMGVTTSKLQDMAKKGQILSETFLPKLAAELKKTFHLDGGVTTFQAAINGLQTSMSLFLDKLDSTLGISAGARAGLVLLTNTVDFLTQHINSFIQALGAMAGVLIALNLGTLARGFMVVVSAIRLATVAMLGLNAAVLANPMGGLIALLGRLGIAAAGAAAGWQLTSMAIGESQSKFAGTTQAVKDFITMSGAAGHGIGDVGKKLQTELSAKIDEANKKLQQMQAEMLRTSTIANGLSISRLGLIPEASGGQSKALDDLKKQIQEDTALLKTLQGINVRPAGAPQIPGMSEAELRRRAKALAELNMEMDQAMQRLDALKSTGGIEAFKDLEVVFKQEKDFKRFRDNLEQAGITGAAAAIRLRKFMDITIELGNTHGLALATEQLGRMNAQMNALRTGGIPALEKLNQQFARDDKVKDFAESLRQAGMQADKAAPLIAQFRDALPKMDELEIAAKKSQEAIESLRNSAMQGFGSVGDALAEMAVKGKVDLDSLSSALQQMVGQILKTVAQLAVINPLMNSIFGMSGSAGLPTLGIGAFGGGGITELGAAMPWLAAKGGTFSGLRPMKMARGGLLNRPTMFSSGQGPVIGGEAGTEAIMPLKRTASGQLGVVSTGGGRTNNISVVIQTPNPSSFRASEAQVATAMRRAVASANRNM